MGGEKPVINQNYCLQRGQQPCPAEYRPCHCSGCTTAISGWLGEKPAHWPGNKMAQVYAVISVPQKQMIPLPAWLGRQLAVRVSWKAR